MGCTLKDSFFDLIEYITYRQEKDEEFFITPRPFFFASTASVFTDAVFSYEL